MRRAPPAAAPEPVGAPAEDREMSAARVLVLDHEAAVGSLVARVATKLGFEVSVTQESEFMGKLTLSSSINLFNW